jgi:hypothetical protein
LKKVKQKQENLLISRSNRLRTASQNNYRKKKPHFDFGFLVSTIKKREKKNGKIEKRKQGGRRRRLQDSLRVYHLRRGPPIPGGPVEP